MDMKVSLMDVMDILKEQGISIKDEELGCNSHLENCSKDDDMLHSIKKEDVTYNSHTLSHHAVDRGDPEYIFVRDGSFLPELSPNSHSMDSARDFLFIKEEFLMVDSSSSDLFPKHLKKLTENLKEPVVFRNVIKTHPNRHDWKIVDWSFQDIADKMGNMKLPFRVGKNEKTTHLQLEATTPIRQLTMHEFLKESKRECNFAKWFYFDYKYADDWLRDKPEILNTLNWHEFGINMSSKDSTLWIGSKGAHTICHQDTYGCNFVTQTHGRKLWLFFSPECTNKLNPSRIPFEESTVYSKYNFFSPSFEDLKVIKNLANYVRLVILEPKDILFVPHGWWHYVECLENSISINIWVPSETDCKARLKESLVKLVTDSIGSDDIPIKKEFKIEECLKYIKRSLEECESRKEITESIERDKLNTDETSDSLKIKYPNNIKIVEKLTEENFNVLFTKNTFFSNNSTKVLSLREAVLNAYCHPEVLDLITKILHEQLRTNSL